MITKRLAAELSDIRPAIIATSNPPIAASNSMDPSARHAPLARAFEDEDRCGRGALRHGRAAVERIPMAATSKRRQDQRGALRGADPEAGTGDGIAVDRLPDLDTGTRSQRCTCSIDIAFPRREFRVPWATSSVQAFVAVPSRLGSASAVHDHQS